VGVRPIGTAQPKPAKGSHWLEGRERRAERKAREDAAMAEARRRDLANCHGCRWPRCEFMSRKPRLEVAHVLQHRGMGGDRTDTSARTQRDRLMLLCFLHHARVDTGRAEVKPQTRDGTDGPCDYFIESESGRMELVASESRIGVSVERSVR
jgi:hypothetical protein